MASATRKTIEKTVKEDVTVLELTKDEAGAVVHALGMFECDSIQFRILGALEAPQDAPADEYRPVRVGDKVRITCAQESFSVYQGHTGTLMAIDDNDSMHRFRVNFSNGDYSWATTVERVND
jgi:ATP-dependent exoDNAse (exonuclease V) alpha subunit